MKWVAAISISFFALFGWMRRYTGIALLMVVFVACSAYYKSDVIQLIRESAQREEAKEIRKEKAEAAERELRIERNKTKAEIAKAEKAKIDLEAAKIEASIVESGLRKAKIEAAADRKIKIAESERKAPVMKTWGEGDRTGFDLATARAVEDEQEEKIFKIKCKALTTKYYSHMQSVGHGYLHDAMAHADATLRDMNKIGCKL